jgi:hypothetical protein
MEKRLGLLSGHSPILEFQGWPASFGTQLSVNPVEGLSIAVRTKNKASSTSKDWYAGEQFARNIDVGIKYSNATFTAIAAFDDNYVKKEGSPFDPISEYLANAYAYASFKLTAVPKLGLGVETRFNDLLQEAEDADEEAVGITNITALSVSYQITDALSSLLWGYAGAGPIAAGATKQLLGEAGQWCKNKNKSRFPLDPARPPGFLIAFSSLGPAAAP